MLPVKGNVLHSSVECLVEIQCGVFCFLCALIGCVSSIECFVLFPALIVRLCF